MNIVNKQFRNNITGEIIKVIDSYQNIAITEGKDKIDTGRLLDTKYFTEHIDPLSFFNDPNTYNIFADKIKNIDTSKFPETPESVSVYENLNSEFNPATNESAIILSDVDDEMEEIKRKYEHQYGNITTDVSKQNEAFNKILGSNEFEVQAEVEVNKVRQEPYQVRIETPTENIQRFEDPIISIFKNAKRNIDFSITVSIDGKIPRTDFIEMMEDSYELSIIEYLADEFTSNVLKNPNLIRNKIIKEIRTKVYGEEKIKENKPVIEQPTKAETESEKPKRKYTKKNPKENDTRTLS